ncbi:MAG: thrombospondin type 3 repeat-containing protein, partial [Planctomycetota bacterium]
EIEAARRWYWINSGFRLLLEPRYHRIPDVISAGMIAEGGKPNGCPAARELAKRAREAGVDLRRVQGVIVVEAYRKWQEQRWRMVGNGGGLTLGAHGRGYGISWWFAPEKPGMSSWLMCHEFHHQLDALFEISGHAEYWFNHFSPTIGTSADFGEHWDGNAYILRSWPEHLWDSLDLGDAILLGDRDGDGFPDEDDRVPFDEKSFGSSPESRDSDGDGLSDREEVLQSSWVRQSGFETYGGKPVWPNPRSADSDRDGIHDAEDPLPLYRVNPELPAQGFRLLRQLEDEELDGALEIEMGLLGWKGERPELALRLRGLSPSDAVWTRALLDLGGDGWFTGPGNLSVTVHSSGTSPGVRVLNAALPGRWPTDDPRLAARAGVVVERQRGELVIRVPFRKGLGFVASPGHRFGLDLMVSTVKSRASGRGWLTIFEPHDLVAFRLPKTRRARLR